MAGLNLWPWKGATRLDQAQHVARLYRELVQRITAGRSLDPAGDLHRLDQALKTQGVHWHMPNDTPLEPDDWMTAPALAHAIGRTRKDIYNWANLGHITQRAGPDGTPEYQVASVLAYQQRRNQRQAEHGTRR